MDGALRDGRVGIGPERQGCGVSRRRRWRRRGRWRRRWGRTAGSREELEGRRRIHVALAEVSATPLVLDEFDERVVGIRGVRRVGEDRRRPAEARVDERWVRKSVV